MKSRLTVLHVASVDKRGHKTFACRCACGALKNVSATNLRRTMSCECWRRERMADIGSKPRQYTGRTRGRKRMYATVADKQRAWVAANAEYLRAYRTARRSKALANERAYRKAHPGAEQAKRHNRRARLAGNGGSFTAQEWATLLRQYGHRCVGCWKTAAQLQTLGRRLVPDHIVPVVKGGSGDITNISTAVPRSRRMQQQKGREGNRLRHLMTMYRVDDSEIGHHE